MRPPEVTISGTISRHALSYALTKRSTSHPTELWHAFRKNRIRGSTSMHPFSLSLPLFVIRSSARVAQERRVTAAERNKKLGR